MQHFINKPNVSQTNDGVEFVVLHVNKWNCMKEHRRLANGDFEIEGKE